MRSIRFGFVTIAICALVALAAAIQAVSWDRRVAKLAVRQAEISDQILELRNAMAALVDMETEQRGYLLAGDEDYLRPFEARRRDLDLALSRLRGRLQGDRASLDKADAIIKIAGRRRDNLARNIELAKSGRRDAALASVKSGEGKRLMDAFDDATSSLLFDLRDGRAALAATETRKFRDLSQLGAIAAVLLILMTATAIYWLSASIRRINELQLRREREAMHDARTSLPNRRYLNEWLRMALAGAQRGGKRLVLLYLDLDGFKGVNDRLGHEAGDRVLQVTAERLRRTMRASDFVARLGGDEFVAVLPDAPGDSELQALVDRLSLTLAQPPIAEMSEGEVSASIGIACHPQHGGDPEGLLRAADQAMYSVKQRRREQLRHAAGPIAEPAASS